MRLSQTAFLVGEYDPAIAFFRALGFALVQDEDHGNGKRWVVMRPPGGGSDLLIARAVGDQRAAIGNQAGGRVGFFLTSADFTGDAARIEAAGGTFEEAPRHEPYGIVAVFRDPWGNRWDLIQPAGV
ncbi:VOC family protein [Pararhodobacter marinus]|uniref:Extradiol dioxygenase n=1 Tax=Pararhodobacter marinus TaxID=2184063 RepID=A0A2U2C687_9RHOB|nr:VOC family protein [Pararhodobacter marinus]PWE27415.1 extradiol dioxygenase [Pararhodobacter marinus]